MSATTHRVCLRANGVACFVVIEHAMLPRIIHWGADPGPVTVAEFDALASAASFGAVPNGPEQGLILGVLPEARFGWLGTPGLTGSEDGREWSPAWQVSRVTANAHPVDADALELGDCVLEVRASAPGRELMIVIEMLPQGLVRARVELRNLGDRDFQLDQLVVAFPVPSRAREILDFAGRWAVERAPQRLPLVTGTHRREGRRGRTGADAAYVLSVGVPGFGFAGGEVWGVHAAWSGNHIHYAERDAVGAQVIGAGELLLAGEGTLAPGMIYRSPWVYANYADGLDAQAARFHGFLRSLPSHPAGARPVTLNVWEAVYFDHDHARLIDLADRAAALGVERFVLDDGWFGARRDDHAGLGDWVVSSQAWPQGLHPLVDHVTGLGMQFGLWFEPEMVNLDSDVARAHPEWIMQPAGRLPIESRFQQVLNLSIDGAYQHVLKQMRAILSQYAIGYVKWDHNRDLIDAGTAPYGRAAVSAQTRAFYRLLDTLRDEFGHVEFESCSSGGARIDLGVMERVQRVWTSDNIDPHDRQTMLMWSGQLLPTELLGSHIASGRSHVSHRWHDLTFRAATAVFGHLGIEWDLARAGDDELEELGWWVDWYKEHRDVICSGRLVRSNLADPAAVFKGIVTAQQAIYSLAVLDSMPNAHLGTLQFRGLDPQRRYRVTVAGPRAMAAELAQEWMKREPPVLTGRALEQVGLMAPMMRPDTAVLFVVTEVG
ncbi:MAG: alpha-galactosidase [Arachnia sp.]